MTRSADRLLRHFAGNSLESAPDRAGRPIQRQRPMSGAGAVYIYRHPLNSAPLETDSNWSHSLARELGNATGNRLRPVGSIVRRSPRPVRDTNRTPRRQNAPFAENAQTTADELMKLLMEDDGTDRPVIFTIFEAANIDGVKHLSSKNRCTRSF
uniref:Resolvase/invertase-type recombinase catalytic domain-containing protein n=1 Tax=Globodera pallida TaxID=36090 RepID=A0A183CEZ0_GLOPA